MKLRFRGLPLRPRWRGLVDGGRRVARRVLVSDRALRWAYRPVAGSLPIPPPKLIRVAQNSNDPALFAWGGAMAVFDIRTLLYRNGLSLEKFANILDFGCGPGRMIRHLRSLPGTVQGTDYDATMVAWCQRNLPFTFSQNDLDPPLSFDEGQFDFIYGFSVFTHLDEPRQLRWMKEFSRVLRRGGHLMLTTHGTRFLRQLDQPKRRQFEAGELVVLGNAKAGANACTAYHPEAWVRSHLTGELQLVDFVPWGAVGLWGHDMYLFRNAVQHRP